jgi:hypothetical protein
MAESLKRVSTSALGRLGHGRKGHAVVKLALKREVAGTPASYDGSLDFYYYYCYYHYYSLLALRADGYLQLFTLLCRRLKVD